MENNDVNLTKVEGDGGDNNTDASAPPPRLVQLTFFVSERVRRECARLGDAAAVLCAVASSVAG